MGGFRQYNYKKQNRTLAEGDVILMMSDGMAEQFNDGEEMFGYNRVIEAFRKASRSDSADGVIDSMKLACDEWRGGKEQQDDVTLVAVRIKAGRGSELE